MSPKRSKLPNVAIAHFNGAVKFTVKHVKYRKRFIAANKSSQFFPAPSLSLSLSRTGHRLQGYFLRFSLSLFLFYKEYLFVLLLLMFLWYLFTLLHSQQKKMLKKWRTKSIKRQKANKTQTHTQNLIIQHFSSSYICCHMGVIGE